MLEMAGAETVAQQLARPLGVAASARRAPLTRGRSLARLAGRAPIESAAGHIYPLDDGAADEAWLPVPVVNVVDLVALRFAFWVRPVLGPSGHNAPIYHAIGHQLHRIAPDSVQSLFGNILTPCEWVLPRAIEQFGTINVTNA